MQKSFTLLVKETTFFPSSLLYLLGLIYFSTSTVNSFSKSLSIPLCSTALEVFLFVNESVGLMLICSLIC